MFFKKLKIKTLIMQQMVLYNPQTDDLIGCPIHFKILARRPLKKYGFLIDQAVKRGEKIRILNDNTRSSFVPRRLYVRFPTKIKKFLGRIDLYIWLHCNSLPSNCVEMVDPLGNHANDTLLVFTYKLQLGKNDEILAIFRKFKNVVFHLSHYFIDTQIKAAIIKMVPNAILAGDSDITANGYFQRFFYWYNKSFLVLPFAVSERFNIINTISRREKKVIATGSLHCLQYENHQEKYSDYMDYFYPETSYHPIRRMIFYSRNTIGSWVFCCISLYRDYSSVGKFGRILNHLKIAQKSYFSKNLNQIYNQYVFAVVGEEASGFLALGAIEAIASGCILLGDAKCYKGLGLEQNIHYIDHGGSVYKIREIIKAVNVDACEINSKKASQYVKQNFSSAAIYDLWRSKLTANNQIK